MIAHVVLMKPKDDLAPADRRAFVEAFDRAIRIIPSVRGVRVGVRVKHGAQCEAHMPDAGAFLATIEFDDVAGLQEYLAHPAHVELGRLFYACLSSTLVYDFDLGGPERLREIAR